MHPLLAPITLRGGATLPARVTLAPLTNLQSNPDGSLGDDELAWLRRRGAGGFGLIETCASHVTLDGQGWAGELGCFDDRLIPGLIRLAEAAQAHGALGMVQLYHGGVRAPSKLTGVQPLSASVFHEERPSFEAPRAATEEDLARLHQAFVAAAVRVTTAGFRGVEIHGAHGYLFSQFLSATQNQRTDGYGGSLANRARFLREVTRAVRAALPAPAVLSVRLSPEDFGLAHGLDLDETVEVARWLADDGVDLIHLSLWDGSKPSKKVPGEHPLPRFRRALPAEVKILAAGNVWSRADAEHLVAQGADLVTVGRAAILDPDWPRHVLAEGREPVRGPLDEAALAARAVSPTFVAYLRARFPGMVA